MNDSIDSEKCPTATPSPASSISSAGVFRCYLGSSLLIHPRREPFEYGLLAIPKLIFTDGILSLSNLKDKLLRLPSSSPHRVDVANLADALQISTADAELVLDTLASVLPVEVVNHESVDVRDLILFLYIQSYKRLLPKTHKDSTAVADVWPRTSAFDGYLSTLNPLQFKRSTSRRFMPSPADEEAHQLSYLDKHMANMVALLADTTESDGEDSLVLTFDSFQHLGLLIQFSENEQKEVPLSQAAPFFVNPEAGIAAVSVCASKALDWLLQCIAISLEHIAAADKSPARESCMRNICDMDVSVATHLRTQTVVEGIYKASVVKQASEIMGHPVKVLNCHDSVIYLLAPLSYATVYGCSDATVVVGAVGKSLRVEYCERVQVITAAKRICIVNCRECLFFLGINQKPLILGDNHNLQVAPFNTYYPQLEEHLSQAGVTVTINRWNEPIVLGTFDPHDSLSHPAGASDIQPESATCLDPNQFSSFLIPDWLLANWVQSAKCNPFPLPEAYLAAQKRSHVVLDEMKEAMRNLQLDEHKKHDIASALHMHFKDWLYASGNIRQLYCHQGE